MKITFIQPAYPNIWECLGLGYIIAYVKKHYVGELEINFFQGRFDDDTTIIHGSEDSDIVAFSCTSPAYTHGLHLARALKNIRPNIHIVFGGWHPTALPREVIKEDCVDQVIVGEGENPFIWVVAGDWRPVIYAVGYSPLLSELEWPDRKAIRNDRTIDLCESMNGRRTASFQMNRGCKVHCKFCSEITMTGTYSRKINPIRSRAHEDVLKEIEAVESRYDINYFKFVDATFDVSPKQVIDFCMNKELYGNDLEWECNIHPSFVQDEEVFEWLKGSRCNQINIGVESGSPRILRDVGKGTSLQSIKNVFKWAKKYGIKRRGFFLLGMPNEALQDIWATETLIDEIEPDVVGFTILCPYPGSDFYDPEKHKDVDWSATDEYSNNFWSSRLSNRALKHTQQRLMDKYSNILCERQENRGCVGS